MRRYRFNWKFALVLGGLLVVTGGGLFALHRFQTGRNAQSLLAASERAEKEGDLDRAAHQLQRYLAGRSDDTDAQLRFAELVERRAGGGPGRFLAIPAYQQVVARDPNRREARQRLVALLTEAKQWKEALPHLTALAKASPNDPAAWAAVGRCHAANGDWASAERAYATASQLTNAGPEEWARLADCQARVAGAGDASALGKATKTLTEMVEKFPKDARAYLFRAGFRAAHSLPGSTDDLATAKQLDPNAADVMLATAAAARKSAEARMELTDGLKHHPKDARFYLALAQMELSEGKPADAIGLLQSGVGKIPDHIDLMVELVHQLLDTGDVATARTTFTAARANRKLRWSPIDVDLLRGRLAVASGDWLEAAKILGELRDRGRLNDQQKAMVNRLLSRNARREGNSDLQIGLLGQSVQAAPTREVQMEYAQALAEAGRLPEAVREFRKLADAEPPVATACVMLARLLLATSPPQTATDASRSEVEGLLDKALKAEPKHLGAVFTRADVLVARGRQEDAQRLLDLVCADKDAGPGPWVARANLEARAGRPDEARRRLDDAGQKFGQPTDVRIARLLLALEYEAAKAVEEIGRETALLDQLPGAQAALVWSLAAQAYLRLERYPLAAEAAKKLVDLTPDDLRSQLLRFQTAIRVGDDAAAGVAVDAVRRIEGPTGGIASYCNAYRLITKQTPGKAVDKAALETARGYLAEAKARRPQWSKVPLLRAQVELLEGQPEQAVQSYREAFGLGERSFDVVRALIAYYAGKKQYQQAYEFIRQMQSDGQVPLTEQKLFTAVYLQAADYSRAVEAAKLVVASDSADPADHLWLALVYATAKKVPEADAELVKACDLANTPEPWVARVQFLMSTDRRKEAESLTDGLPKRLPKERVDLTVAACDEALGRRDLADKSYQAALANQPNDLQTLQAVAAYFHRTDRFHLAEPLFRRVLAADVKLPNGEDLDIRRSLAIGLAEGGNFARCNEALELLKLNDRQTGKEERADSLARAAVLARRPGGKGESIALYERLAPAGLPTPARFVFAKLYLATGKTSLAREQMLLVLGEAGDNLAYISYWSEALIELGNFEDAQFWVTKLTRVAPNRWPTVRLQARLLNARKQTKEAAARVARFTPSDETEAVAVALRLEEYDDALAAEKAWEALTKGKTPPPFVGLKYAEFLGRKGMMSDSLAWCERYKGQVPAPVLAAVAVDILGYDRRADDYMRVEGWLSGVPESGPDAFPAKFFRAELLDRSGATAKATDALKSLVAEQPNNPAALLAYGRLLVLTGSPAEAEKVLIQAVELDGSRTEIVEWLAAARAKLGRTAVGVNDLVNALTEEPTAAGYMRLARLFQSQGDKKAVERNVHEARRFGYKAEVAHPLEAQEVRALLAAYP